MRNESKCLGIISDPIPDDGHLIIKVRGDTITSPNIIIDPEITVNDILGIINNKEPDNAT